MAKNLSKLPTITFDEDAHRYTLDGEDVPSVTQLLDQVTPKPAIGWWSFRVGLSAVLRILQEDQMSWPAIAACDVEETITGRPTAKGGIVMRRKKPKTPLEAAAMELGQHPNAIRDKKGDLGTLIHDAIQNAGIEDHLPVLSEFDEEVRGYLQGFAKFWLQEEPFIVEQEVIVGSREHRYAGRLDLIAEIRDGKRVMIDFKTGKGIYPDQFEQLVMYEAAYYECQGEPLEGLWICRLDPEGDYEFESGNYVHRDIVKHIAGLGHLRTVNAAVRSHALKGKS